MDERRQFKRLPTEDKNIKLNQKIPSKLFWLPISPGLMQITELNFLRSCLSAWAFQITYLDLSPKQFPIFHRIPHATNAFHNYFDQDKQAQAHSLVVQ